MSQAKSNSRVLRPTDDVFLGGLPAPLLTRKLPRVGEIALAMEYYKLEDKDGPKEAKRKVAEDLVNMYKKASFPTINPLKIAQKVEWVQELVKERRKDMVNDKRFDRERVMGKHRKKSGNGSKRMKYVEVKDKLLMVAAKDVPEIEKEFYEDQLGERRMEIGGVDKKEERRKSEVEEKDKRREARQEMMQKQSEKENRRQEASKKVTMESDEEDEDEESEENDELAKPLKKKHKRYTQSELEKMKKVFEEAERWNLSEQGTASMINVMNASSGKITLDDQSKVLIPTTVHKLKKKFRTEKVEERMGKTPLAVGVDERIDKTKKEMGEGMKGAKRYQVVKEEHATVIFWPGETYEGHVVPTGGTGKELAKSTFDFLKSRQTDLSQLRALLGDGCSKVTGCWTGFMAEMERLVSQELGEVRELLHIVCINHHAEKVFEKVFFFYDGVAAGPNVFSGPIGTLLTLRTVHTREIVNFVRFDNPELLHLIQTLPPMSSPS